MTAGLPKLRSRLELPEHEPGKISAHTPTAPISQVPASPWRKRWLIAAVLLTATAGLPAAEVRCASARSMDHLMTGWTRGFTALHPDTPARITRRAEFSADFVSALASGEVQVAPFARELFASERAAISSRTGGEPQLVPVASGSRATKGGTHAIVIFVNARNPIAHLAMTQLRALWSRDGAITTWGQLGLTGEWATRKISLHGMRLRRGTGNPPGIVNFLESRVLAGHGWREGLHEYDDLPAGAQALEQIVRAVAADEAAIGYSGFAYALPGVRTVALGETEAGPFFTGTDEEIARRQYPLTRTIYLCTGPSPNAATREFIHYVLSPTGQAAIAADEQGFFPLNPTTAILPPARPEATSVQGEDGLRGAGYVGANGAIAIIGYNDMAEMLAALNARFQADHPRFRFGLTLNGTRTAPPALARGASAFAPMGAEFSPAELADYRAATGGEPRCIRVAHDSLNPRALSGPLAVIVHRTNPLTSLTLAEVGDIFSGRNSRGLHPCGLKGGTALGLCMRRQTLGGGGFNAAFKGFSQSREVVDEVARDPLAIGFTAGMRVEPGVKALALAAQPGEAPVALTEENLRAGRYPLDRFLLIYFREPLEPWLREYLTFVLSAEGQEIIARGTLGYLPLNAAERAAELRKLD